MSPEREKYLKNILDSMPLWFWDRHMDDNCICGAQYLNPNCTNKRCLEYAKDSRK